MRAVPIERFERTFPDMVERHVKTVPIAKNKELRVGIATTPTSASATIQKWVRESGHTEWTPAGRVFYVFRSEIAALSKAISLAAQAIDDAA